MARFARQVARYGDRLAVKMGAHALTYAELDRAANRIAHALLARLGPGNEPVALLLPQGPGQVAAVLGALKAGKIYVPLDVAQAARRLGDVVADSGARLVVTDSLHLGHAREAVSDAGLLDLDALPHDGPHEAPDVAIAPDAGAYIFYTSGSTGAPKGVLDTHRNVLHNVMRYTNTLRFGPDDRLTLLQGPSFSGAVSSLFGALLNGAASFPFDVPREGSEAIAAWLAAEAITIYHSVPALFRHVARHGAALPALRVIRLEGDRATVRDLELFAEHFAAPCVLVNGLGATECGLVRQFFFRPGQPLPGAVVPIGGPVEDMDVVVLGDAGRPAPPGGVGEIAVRSAYLASGYWRRPDLTARRFLPDPDRPGARMYLTGDTGRLHADGTLDYLGRQDGLAKVRGQRVEVAEVETALLAVPGVAEAAVTVREDRPGEPRVVAYLVAGAEGVPRVGALRRALAERLPNFMVPAAFVTLPCLPLDDNGKVDRRALPPPAAHPQRDRPAVAPRNHDEATVARLWGAALGLEEIGVEDDFFEIGGDSLRAALMLAEIRKATGLELGAAAFAESPTVAAIAQRLIAARGRRTGAAAAAIPRRPAGDPALPRASFAQEALWFLDQMDPGSALYNVAPAWRLRGPLDVAALERSLQHLVDRHESLRTVFVPVDGQPHQRVLPALMVPLPVTDCSTVAAEDREAEVMRAAAEERRAGFDLARGPLIRARLFRLGPADHVLAVTVHHIVTDGWSMDVLARELGHGYRSARAGRTPELAPLPIQFADFAAWQRERLSGPRLMRLLDYWRERLAGRPAAPALPADRQRPARPTFLGGRERLAVPAETLAAVRALGREEGATLYMVLLAAFALVLSRHTGQTDLLIGSPLADRTRRETWSGIGLYLNTLTLRIDLSESPSFRELIRRVRATALDAFDHQELPFDRLVEALRPDRSAGAPYLSVLFNLHNQPSSGLALEELEVEPVPAAPPRPKFELNLAVEETRDGLAGALVYDAEIFDAETIRRVLDAYRHLLAHAAAEPDRRIGDLPLMGEDEPARVLALGRGPRAPLPPVCAIHAAVAAQAARTPDAPALVAGDAVLSYATLERRANRLARHLRAHAGGADLRVGVCLPRSPELVIALLAVLKAGAAYVALDPAEPPARLAVILEDAGARAVITSDALARRCGGHGRAVIRIDADAPAIAREDGAALEMDGGPDDLAYIAYTSGSTGRPKGVPTRHRGVLSYLDFLVRQFELGPTDTVLQLCRTSFDASVREIFGPLTSGGCVVLLRDDEAADPEAIVARLREHRVTALLALVPSVLRPAAAAAERGGGVETLRLILTTGEPLRFADARLVERALAPRAALVNQYGPTECTMTSTWYPVGRGESSVTGDALVPIGHPIANVHAHVLDDGGGLVPPGVPGELHIGGVGVASGYLGDQDLTARRFVPDPFAEAPGARMFKTGDLVRSRADGTLEFLGRMDRQVKVRGIRVEPGETEHVLVTHPAVAEAAVMPWEAAPGDQRLAAYVVAREGVTLDPAELRRFARERLPAPLVPAAIVGLAALPLTPNGKLDRAALPPPGPTDLTRAGEYVAPSTPLETAIAEVWSDVLGVPRIGVRDDFFELGGHSLLATRLLVRLRDRLSLDLSLRQLFETPTVAGMVDALLEQELAESEAAPEEGDAPASLAATLARHARSTPEAPAILAPGRPALTYRGLADEIARIGGVLADAGLGRGARVALVMPQGPELAVALLGVASVAIALPLDPAAPRPELERVLAAARLDAVIVAPGDITPAREAAAALGLRVVTLDVTAGSPAGPRELPRTDDVAVVLHTSGTTARPKRVPLTHANLLASAQGHGRALALTPEDRCLNLMPLHHVNGLGMLVASLVAGSAVVCPPRFDPTRVFAWLDEARPTWLNATPTLHRAMLTLVGLDAAGAGQSAARASLRLIRSASSPLPARVMRELEALFHAPVVESYGQTETTTLVTVVPLPPHPRAAGSVGVPAGPDIGFLGEDGQITPGLRSGEVVVRGANVMAAYEDDPAASDAAFVDGWFRTGDVGRLDEEGQLHLSGRIHDIVNRGGEKIAPREIEELLLSHPDVAEAVAFAVPHPTLGEDVGAAVVPRLGVALAPEALRRFAAERIAESRVPHRIAVLAAIPTGATGKPDRAACARVLQDLAGREPERHPLSPSQAQLWVLDRLQPGAPVYSMPRAFRLGGRLDAAALERALAAVVARHAALRTVYHAVAGEPVQEVESPRAVPLALVDLSELAPPAREDALAVRLDAEARRPFDLSRDLMLRAALYRLGPEDHVLFVNMHHIASDGRSYGVFYEELAALYARETARPSPALATSPLTYAAHARSQRERLARPQLEAEIAYWRGRLAGAPADPGLPTDRPRPALLSHRGGLRTRTLPPALLGALRALARETRATSFMTLLAAFQTLLHRESGETDFVVGIAVDGRTPELSSLIGYFVNTVPVRADLTGDPSFRALVERVRARALETYGHVDLPFARLVEALAPERRLDRAPLVQVMLVQDNARQAEAPPLAGLEVHPIPLDPGITKLDLTVTARESPEGLRLTAEYSADLFDPETIERLLAHFECLLASAVATPERPLSELSLLPEAERAQLDAWSEGPPALVSPETLLDAIAGQAARRPDAIAIESDGRALTYRELTARADALARHLRRLGAGPDRPVGVCMDRGPELVPAVLAVLQAGGTYLPLDPDTPAERLRFIVNDAQPLLVLADAGTESRLRKLDARVLCPEREAEALERAAGGAPPPVDADALAYVMYTSGSTGRPKGVLVPHRAIAHHARWMQQVLPLREDDAVLGWTPLGFDPSVWEMLGPLAAGARVVLAPPGAHRDPRALAEIVAKAGITVLQTLPSLLGALCEEPAFARATRLRRILCGGEALGAPLAARVLRDLDVELVNLYGPTEATIDATWWRCRAGDARVPIGRPIAGARVRVLDPRGEPTPVGVPGELYIGGTGVARGYLNQPRLTAERFLDGGARYRTGDRARWRSDGALEFLGRLDRQVKLRGLRIELGEIEAALGEHADVGAAAVALREEPGAEAHLVAWVTPRSGRAPDREALRRHLATRLPAAMIPADLVVLDALPMLAAGKVDHAALPVPGADARLHAGAHEAPRTESERALAALWQELLGVARVGRSDDFFALGGHSLLAARLAARLEERLGVEVPLRRIFETPILADLARACPLREPARPAGPADGPPVAPALRTRPGPPPPDARGGDARSAPGAPTAAGPAALEAQVAAILSEVLGTTMGRDDDFIASGGDSLLAAIALARVADALGVRVRLVEFFASPTAAAVAAVVGSRNGTGTEEAY